jgi:hypothetical protein
MKLVLSILNEMSGFKVCVYNGVYKVKVSMFFKNLNNVKSYTPLDVSILNLNISFEIYSIDLI